MRKLSTVFVLCITVACLYAVLSRATCHKKTPDVADIALPIAVTRLERALFAVRSKEELQGFLQQHPCFAQKFLGLATPQDERRLVDKLYAMINDPSMRQLYEEVERVFGDFSGIQQQFTQAFRYLRYYYPAFEMPQIVTFITGMGTDLSVSDDLIVIGLDFFLGEGARFKPIQLPQYLLNTYQPAYIVPKVILLLSQRFNQMDAKDQTLLADMLYYGKAYYFTKAVLPGVEDHLLIGYTAKQFQEVHKHQAIVWEHFIDNALLYETNHLVKQKYISDRPFTAELGPQCPGNIGRWLGWEIVKRYVTTNPGIKLPEVMRNPNAQLLFTQAKYRPK